MSDELDKKLGEATIKFSDHVATLERMLNHKEIEYDKYESTNILYHNLFEEEIKSLIQAEVRKARVEEVNIFYKCEKSKGEYKWFYNPDTKEAFTTKTRLAELTKSKQE